MHTVLQNILQAEKLEVFNYYKAIENINKTKEFEITINIYLIRSCCLPVNTEACVNRKMLYDTL